jgi:hypothetical protein
MFVEMGVEMGVEMVVEMFVEMFVAMFVDVVSRTDTNHVAHQRKSSGCHFFKERKEVFF